MPPVLVLGEGLSGQASVGGTGRGARQHWPGSGCTGLGLRPRTFSRAGPVRRVVSGRPRSARKPSGLAWCRGTVCCLKPEVLGTSGTPSADGGAGARTGRWGNPHSGVVFQRPLDRVPGHRLRGGFRAHPGVCPPSSRAGALRAVLPPHPTARARSRQMQRKAHRHLLVFAFLLLL